MVDVLFPVGDKSGTFFFFEDPVKDATLFHKHLYMSGSRDANLKTKCLHLCLIVSPWTTRSVFCGIMLKGENKTKKTKRGRLGVGREMNEGLLMSLCCRDNVNLIIQRAGTSAFAFLTSHDVSAFFFFLLFILCSLFFMLLDVTHQAPHLTASAFCFLNIS